MTIASLNAGGLEGDRQYGLIDAATGLSSAPEREIRWRKALHLQSKCVAGKLPTICFPNKRAYHLNDRSLNAVLSDFFGFAAAVAVYDGIAGQIEFPRMQYRNQHFPMHLLTTTSLKHLANLRQVDAIDSRRFRPTVLIEVSEGKGFIESEWIGRRLRLGDIDLIAQDQTKRCGMTFISQPGLEDDPEILRTILRNNKRNLGIYCSIEGSGTIQVGDPLLI